jgi:hypothetical protein
MKPFWRKNQYKLRIVRFWAVFAIWVLLHFCLFLKNENIDFSLKMNFCFIKIGENISKMKQKTQAKFTAFTHAYLKPHYRV